MGNKLDHEQSAPIIGASPDLGNEHIRSAPPSKQMSETPATFAALRNPLLAGGRVILTAQMMRLLVRVASAMLLTRLLTPEAYGLQGMALTVYGLLYMTRDFGVLTAAQQPDFTQQRFNAYCRLGLIGGLVLALLGAALGWPVAWLFHEPQRLPPVLAGMSAAFLFSGAAAPALGVLYREQKIATLAAIEVAAMTMASAVAVLAAWAGLGVWSLVLLVIVNEATVCAAGWRLCPWRPGRDTGDTRWRSLLGFGANLTGYGVTDYYARNLDQVAVGWSAGPVALGLYGRGVQITVLPVQFAIAPFTGWIVASLGRLRAQPPVYTAFFRQMLTGLLHVSLPAAIVCVVAPDAVVRLLYGPAWLAAAPVVRWLGLLLAIQPWLFAPVWLLQSTGRVRRLFAWSTAGMLMIATACFSTCRLGFTAVAAASALSATAQAGLGMLMCRGCTPARISDLLQPARMPLLLHGGLMLLLLLATAMGGGQLAWGCQLGALGAVGLLYYAVAFLASRRVRNEVYGHFLWPK